MFRVRRSGESGFVEEDVQFEQFNCYLHSDGRRENDGRAVDFGDFSEGVDEFIRERMKKLRKKLD